MVALNALHDNLDLGDADSIAEYALHGINVGSAYGDAADDLQLLTTFIHNVASHIRNNNTRAFDTSRPCAVCGQTGHPFDDCPLLQDKREVTRAYIRIVTALKRLLGTIGN